MGGAHFKTRAPGCAYNFFALLVLGMLALSISTQADEEGSQGTNRSGEGGEEPAMWPRISATTTRRER